MVLNYILLENIIWKKVAYSIKFYLQLLCVAGYLKHSNYNIQNSNDKYTNYNIIEIYINRLSTTTQIFIAMDYLIMMSEKYLYFRKRKKHLVRAFLAHPIRSNWIHENLKEIWIIQDEVILSKLSNLSKLIIFLTL